MYDEYIDHINNSQRPEVWEYDSTKHSNPETFQNYNSDTSAIINNLPSITIQQALKKFEFYELNEKSNGIKQESPVEKLKRIQEEIKELELNHTDLNGVSCLSLDLKNALKVKEKTPIYDSENSLDKLIGDGTDNHKLTGNISNLESRITQLETALGNDSLNSANLFQQLDNVNRKLSLLEPCNMQALEQKIIAISVKLQGLSKHTMTEDEIAKLNNLEKLVCKLNKQVPIIPVLSNRLESLKTVHENVVLVLNKEFKNSSRIEKFGQTSQNLENLVNNFEKIVLENSKILKNNLGNLESRILKIEQRA